MSQLDDLQAAGFTDKEVGDYAAQQHQMLSAAGFSEDEITQHLGVQRQPDTGGANKAFARVIGNALSKAATTLKPAGETVADVGSVYAPVEAALNAGTGLLFGFPAYVGGALGGLVSKHLLGMDADPKELAETMSKVFTYQPMTERGQRLAGNVMLPLTMLQEGSEWTGHQVTDLATKAGAGTNTAAALGAVTDATIQMLAPSLLGELARKMGGQTITNDDMRNTAKVIAGPDATHEVVAAVEQGLQSTYQKTGIGPYTVLDDAHKNPQIAADLANPKLEIPKAYEQHVEKPAEGVPTPGDGAPLLDVSGQLSHEKPKRLFDSEKEAVHEDIASQIEDTGRASPEQAQAYATLQSEFYAAMAEREGKTPGELFREQPLNVAADMAGELEQPAYHGSPHDFEKFDSRKIGTGEGAQAYGHGLYFAENKDIAEGYRKTLSDQTGTVGGKPLNPTNPAHIAAGNLYEAKGNRAAAAAELRTAIDNLHLYPDGAEPIYREAVRLLESGKRLPKYKPAKGALYQVDIPDEHVAKMLLWDKPLSEQPEAVRKIIEGGDIAGTGRNSVGWKNAPAGMYERMLENTTGEQFYRDLSQVANGDRAASRLLNELGINGIKYLDEPSRPTGGPRAKDHVDTHNLVVFDDSIVNLTHKNGEPVTKAERDAFFQGESKGPRGAYSRTSNTISLFASSDASTFLHESGHQFLTMLERFASSERGSEMSKADFDTLLKHYGEEGATAQERVANWQSKSVDEQRATHESFAKDVEQYFSSGKAPTPKLQAAFDLFRDWLTRVYQSVTGMGRPVSPEVQGVIDRMLGKKEEPVAPEGGPVEMNAGMNPAASLRAIRDSYTPFVGVASPDVKPPPVNPVAGGTPPPNHPIIDSLQKIFAPASRGEIAQAQANIMRANFGEMAREREVALTKMEGFAATFDKMPVADNVKFIDAYEHGVKLADPQLNAAAEALHALNQSRREAIQALGKGQLENFDENYLGRIWKDDTGRAERDMAMRRPLEGSKNMLKKRTIPYYTDGLRWRAYDAEGDFIKSFDNESAAKLAAGTDGRVGAPLTPITTNPVEMALLKVREADKYIYGQKIFAEMKDADLARFVRFGASPLPGWTKINDKIARVFQPNEGEGGGMILRGEYYAPDQAATLINNHLSPGFQGNGFFDAWRGIGNAVNGLQLGLSAFHVGFTSMDAMISKAALGVMQISRGDVLKGAGNVAQGLNPAQPFLNIYKGDKLLRAYLGDLGNPDLAPIVDAIQQAGGRVKMDDFYRNAQVNAFKQALRAEDYKGAAKAFLPTVLDRISAPIFEWLVPRQKLGVFFDMAKDWIEQNPKADLAAKRAGLGKLWDSVDNRMGQLVYDNVFWDRALKDGLMATVRSVGWNLGTFRELGGGVLDIRDIGRDKGFSSRTAYVVALPLLASIYGSMLNYAFTGEAPQSLKDTFYPRTGKLRPDGSEDRVTLPTYMKDVFAYGEDAHNFAAYGGDPTQTIKNKMHPLISTVSQMLNNKDFFGGAIRNPSDKAVEQIADEVAFLIQQFSPFSYRNYIQQAKVKGEEPTVMGYLTSPSMIGVTPAPGYMVKSEEELESGHVSQMHDSLMTKFKQEIKGGKDPETLIPEMVRSGLTRRDIKYIISSSGDIPKPHRLKKFGSDDE